MLVYISFFNPKGNSRRRELFDFGAIISARRKELFDFGAHIYARRRELFDFGAHIYARRRELFDFGTLPPSVGENFLILELTSTIVGKNFMI